MKIHVLTLCTGYPYSIFQRFVGSLYDTGFSGKCYIFCSNNDLQNLKKLKEEFPNVVSVLCDFSKFQTHLQSSRYKYMADFLENVLDYDYLFICDSRDVLFQKNIEELTLEADLYAFEEEKIIKDCTFNSRWIKDVERVLEKSLIIDNETILCSGTFFLSKQKSKYFLETLFSFLINPLCSRDCGVDQGIYNYLCRQYPLGINIRFLNNIDNVVNTLGYGYKEVLDSKIVNVEQQVSYVVHQYDRMSQKERNLISIKYDFCV